MRALAFDLATSTGWSVAQSDSKGPRILESGVQRFDKRRGESNGLVYLRFRKWVYDIIGTFVDGCRQAGEDHVVAYEMAHLRGGAASELALALQTRVQEAAAFHGIICVPVHTATLRSFIGRKKLGKGKVGKADSVDQAEKLIGRAPETDDEADAINLSVLVLEDVAIVEPVRPVCRRVDGDKVIIIFSPGGETQDEFAERVRRTYSDEVFSEVSFETLMKEEE